MPTHLQVILPSSHSAQSLQGFLARKLQAFPDSPLQMDMAAAMAVARSKRDLHVCKPVNKTHQQVQQEFIQGAAGFAKQFGSAELSKLLWICSESTTEAVVPPVWSAC